jgi:chemotaxis protein methyltransferase WspC
VPQPAKVGARHAEALLLADRGRFDEAAALCGRYLQEQPPHADVYCLLGLIHEAAQRSGEAEKCYLKALYLGPDHFETLIHLSLLYRQQGDSRKAALYRRRAEAGERRPDGTVAP